MGVELARKLDTELVRNHNRFAVIWRERERWDEGEEREMNKSESEERRKRKN